MTTPTNIERVWQCFKTKPGATVADAKRMLAKSNIPQTSISSFVSQLIDHGALRKRDEKAMVKGREVFTYEVTRDTFREDGDAAPTLKRVARALTPAPALQAPPGFTVPDVADIKLKTEKLWRVMHANPGANSNDLMAVSDQVEIPPSSVPAMLSTMLTRGQIIADKNSKPWRYVTVGDSYTALASIPDAPPQAEPVGKHKRRGQKVTRWAQEEIEALCRKWAYEHVTHGLSLSDKSLERLARMEDQDYRPRTHINAALRRKFMENYMPIVQAEIDDLRAAKAKPPEPVMAPAPAPEPMSLGALIDRAIREAVATEAQKWAGHVMQAVQDALRSIPGYHGSMPKHDPTPPAPAEAPAKKGPKVIVVNALPEQFQSVKRAFPELDLRHVEHRMPGEDDADLVISLTKFMTHPLDRSLRKKYGQAYCPVNGAADSVKAAITARLNIQRVQ